MKELYNPQILEHYRKSFQIDYDGASPEAKSLAHKAYEEMLDRVLVMDEQTRQSFLQAEMEYFLEKRDKVKKEVQSMLKKLAEEPGDKKNRTVFVEELPSLRSSQTGKVIAKDRKIYSHYELATRCVLESPDYSKELLLLQKHYKKVGHSR